MIPRIVAAFAVVIVLAQGAQAADALVVPVSQGNAQLPLYEESAFDWNGFYAGVYGVGQTSPAGGLQYGLGVNVGVNAVLDSVVLGADVALHGLTGASDTVYGRILGRAGLLVSDDLLVFATAGYGVDLGAPVEEDILVGGGLEFAVSQDISLRAQYLHGFPVVGDNPKEEITLGAQFHF